MRSEDGSVAFSDTSRGQPQVFYAVAKLTRDIAKGVCGLAALTARSAISAADGSRKKSSADTASRTLRPCASQV